MSSQEYNNTQGEGRDDELWCVTLFKATPPQEDEDDEKKRNEEDDHFVSILLSEKGKKEFGIIKARIVPVLDFIFTTLDILWRHLLQPHEFHGMILTSPRCVESLKKCIELADGYLLWETELKENWLNKKIFCVGPSTATRFLLSFGLDEGFREKIITSIGGNSLSLAKSILEEEEKAHIQLPLLYPCGSLKMDTLGSCLTERNIPFEIITVYNTIQNSKLENALLDLRNTSTSDTDKKVYVFFSPSGVAFILPHLTNVSSKHIVAIGPTTAEALKKSPFIVGSLIHQCSSPTPEGLLEVLIKIKENYEKVLQN